MEFFKQNVWLIGMALGSGIALLWPVLARGGRTGQAVSPTEAVLLMSRDHPLVIDVRDPAEYAQGHLHGARNFPLVQLASRLEELQKYKQKPVLVYCQRGVRSAKACKQLLASAFTQVYQLEDGLEAWQKQHLPVHKSA